MSGEDRVQRGFRVTGRVQGVLFRVWTRDMAMEMGLQGTVRNRSDGSVEAHVQGPAGKVDAFQDRLREGPSAARVEGVQVIESGGPLPLGSFVILPTE